MTKTITISKYIDILEHLKNEPSDFRLDELEPEIIALSSKEFIRTGTKLERQAILFWRTYVNLAESHKFFEISEQEKFMDFPLLLALELKNEQGTINHHCGTKLDGKFEYHELYRGNAHKILSLNEFSETSGNDKGDQGLVIGMSIDIIYNELMNQKIVVLPKDIKHLAPFHYNAMMYKETEQMIESSFKPLIDAEYKRVKKMR